VTHILLVDDDARFRRTLRLALDSSGYQVGVAANGAEALDAAAAKAPDLVVLDWHMPEFDGLRTCRALRATSDVPIIMISADRSHSREVALKAGAADYLTKPFSLEDLLGLIESALKN
jgi:DNA-binding response OmpR family regulator